MLQPSSLPPQSVEDEQTVLGACMVDADAMETVAEILVPQDFYSADHRAIFKAIMSLHESGRDINTVAVHTESQKTGEVNAAYLAQLERDLVSAGNVAKYAGIVKEKADRRQTLRVLTQGVQDIHAGAPLTDVMNNVLHVGGQIGSQEQTAATKLSDVAASAIAGIEERMKTGGVTGIPTGFKDLDALLSGLHDGDLITIAARTSAGKSSLARQIAVNVATGGKTVMVFSLEMSVKLMAELILCMKAEVDLHEIQRGGTHDGSKQIERLVYAAQTLESANIYLDASATQTDQVCTRSRLHARHHGLDLIIIDYLQLIEGEKGQSREREVASVSRSLKLLASELNVPVIALSQFNRRVDFRQGGPRLSDLRESGAIEQDSDVVMFVERVDTKKEPTARGNAKLTVKKQRSGPLGVVWLVFRKEYTRFESAKR